MSGEVPGSQAKYGNNVKSSLTNLTSLAGTVVPEDTTDVSYYASQANIKYHGDKSFMKPKVRDMREAGRNRRNDDSLTAPAAAAANNANRFGGHPPPPLTQPTPLQPAAAKQKPTRELYRPPVTGNCLNPSAKEFAPLQSSKSVDFTTKGPQDNIILNRTGLTITVPGKNNSIAKSRSVTSHLQLSTDRSAEPLEQRLLRTQIDLNLFAFPLEVVNTLNKALDDPNRVPGRSLMELVKQILNKVISKSSQNPTNADHKSDHSRLPEHASRLCIGIIEKEEKETFLESLINTCQELYHDRERLLRQDIHKWNSYISFLNQMYGLLKRKQLHFLRKYEGVAPKLVLLSLLAECCTATLTSSLQSVSEIEMMFLVLTHIGRDLDTEMPGRMSLLVTCLREAFLTSHLNKQIGKTLLQLIELRAAGWNLPAQAVMYYYPGSSA